MENRRSNGQEKCALDQKGARRKDVLDYTTAAVGVLLMTGILPALMKAALDALTDPLPEWAQFAVLFGGFAALAVWLGFKAGNAIEGR